MGIFTKLFKFKNPTDARAYKDLPGEKAISRSVTSDLKRFGKGILFLLFFGLTCSAAVAQTVVTVPVNAQNICSNLAVGGSGAAFTTLGNIVVTEGNAADFAFGGSPSILSLTLNAPAGWQFNTSSTISYSYTGANINAVPVTSTDGLTTTSLTINVSGTGTTVIDAFTITGLQVQALNTSSANGNITASSSIGFTGITPETNFSSLSLSAALIPSVSIAASPSGTICAGTPVTFTATPVNGGSPTYQWQLDGTNINGATGATYTTAGLTNGQTVSVVMVSNETCTTGNPATSNGITTLINPNLPVSVSITSSDADNNICEGTSVTFSVTALTNGGTAPLYQWNLNGSPITNATEATYTTTGLSNNDRITLTVTSATDCVIPGTSNEIRMTVNVVVVPSVTITSSSQTTCPGVAVTFSAVTPINGGTSPVYQWMINGTNVSGATGNTFVSSTLVNGDRVSLSMTSSVPCASPNPFTTPEITIIVNPPIPGTPGSITGISSTCPGVSGIVYSIEPVQNASSYNWNVPGGWSITAGAGTSSITVTAGAAGQNGNVSVSAINACGESTLQSLVVNVSPGTPLTPAPIAGTAAVCPLIGSITYTTALDPNATSYLWTVPPGWSINSGDGTNSIIVSSGSFGQNGNVSVSAVNSCGTSTPRLLAVTVNPAAPNTPGVISGNSIVCPATGSLTYSIAPVPNATSYTWTVPNGWVVNSGGTSNSITVTSGATAQSGDIAVIASNSCGSSTASILAVGVSPGVPSAPGTITAGTTSICPATGSLTYSISAVANASTYTWAVPAGWIMNSGQGTTSISVTSGAAGQNGNISVTAGNNCGTSVQSAIAVTVNPGTPGTPAAITGSTAVCINRTGLIYSVPAVTNATGYSWIVPEGWTITAGGSTRSITVSTNGSAAAGNITVAATNPCGTSSVQSLAISMSTAAPASPEAPTGPISICPIATGLVYSVPAVANATNYTWNLPQGWTITSGEGTNSITASVGNGARTGDSNLSVIATNACDASAVSSSLVITIGSFATADITTASQSLCIGQTLQLNGVVGGAVNSGPPKNYNWSVIPANGGTFNKTEGNDPIFTPSAAGISLGSVTIILTSADPAGNCNSATDQIVLTIRANPTASISGTTSICSGANTNLTFTATPNTTVTYRINNGANQTISVGASGSAVLNTGNLSANATYSLVSVNYSIAPGCIQTVVGTATVTVNPLATVNAGTAASICESANPASIILSGSSVGGGASTGAWAITQGGGALSSTDQTVNPSSVTYTPLAGFSGTVILTLTTNATGACPAVSATKTITINAAPTANAGGPNEICQSASPVAFTLSGAILGGGASTGAWSITQGGGTLSSMAQTSNPGSVTYTPAAGYAGAVTLTLTTNAPGTCTPAVATRTITISPAIVVVPGASADICQSPTPTPFVLAGASISGGANTAAWSITSGGGTLSNTAQTGDPSAVTYTPAVNFTGVVTLTLTTNTTGACNPVSATKTLNINAAPTVNAGSSNVVCQSSNPAAIALSGSSVGGGAITGAWSINGNVGGTLSNTAYTSNPSGVTYTPPANYTGDIILTLTTNAPGACSAISMTRTITVNPAATVSAGPAQSICSNASAVMDGSFSGGASSAIWSSSGSGTFNNNSPNANYTPSANDINAGSVTLTYRTNDPDGACGAVSATMLLTIRRAVVITSQPSNTSICATFAAELSVVAEGDGLTYQWYKGIAPGGTPVVNSTNITGATQNILRFSQAALTDDGTYYVIVSGSSQCSPVTSASRTLNVDQAIAITSQPASSQTVCVGSTVIFNVAANANGDPLSYQWRKNGANIQGQTSAALTLSNVGAGDAANYDVLISGTSGYTCTSVQSAIGNLVVNAPVATPVFASGATSTRCQAAASVTYLATASNSTGLTYTLDNTSLSAGNTIAASTGVVTFTAGWSGTSVITVSAAGCSGPTNASHTVTVTTSVGTPNSPVTALTTLCQASGPTIFTASASNATGYEWSVSGSGNSISGTGTSATVNWAANFSGTATITVRASGCNGLSSPATTTMTITPTVGVPSNPTPSASTICQGSSPTTYTSSATNATGYLWTVSAGGTISGTGTTATVSWDAGFSGSATVSVQAQGCNGPSSIVSTQVTVRPTVSIPVFVLGASSNRCQGAGMVTYTATANNSTGITYSLDATSLTAGNSINSTSGVVTYAAAFNGTSVITASAAGCNGPLTASHSVTSNPLPVGGTLSPALIEVCVGGGGTLTLSGYTGTIVNWQSSINGGATWSNIGNTSASYVPTGINQTTLFRAVIGSGICTPAYSSVSVISALVSAFPTTTATPSTICVGESTVLTSTTGYQTAGISTTSGDFSNANSTGWRRDGQSNGDFLTADRDNTNAGPWGETNGPKTFTGITYNGGGGKFAVVDGNLNSTLETPIFTLIGQNSATFTFSQAYNLAAGATAIIEISTDGGASYTIENILAQYTGPATFGITGTTGQVRPVSLSLEDYIGMSNLRIRFRYIGSAGSSWAIDDIGVPATLPITYGWTSNPSTIFTDPTTGDVTVSPTVTTIYTLTTYLDGCASGISQVTVIVNPLPTISPAPGSAGVVIACNNAAAQLTPLPYTATNLPMPGTYNITWSAAAVSAYFVNVSGAALPAESVNLAVPAGTPAGTYTGMIAIRNANGCLSAPAPFSLVINPAPTLGSVYFEALCDAANETNLTVNLTGLLPNSNSTMIYQIGSGTTVTVNNVTADASGNGSFQIAVSSVNDGQTFTITAISSTTAANALSCPMIPGGNNTMVLSISAGYVWTGLAIPDNDWSVPANWRCGVPPNGASVIIPQVSNGNFPQMDVDFNSHNFELLGNATIELNGFTLDLGTSVASSIRDEGWIIGSQTSKLIIKGVLTESLKFLQPIAPAVGTTNALLNLTVNSPGQTATLGNSVWVYGNANPTAGIINSAGNLTMVSTAATSSNITRIIAPADVTGEVNVQSYITGDGVTTSYRGFRSMSSPINDALITNGKKTYRQIKDYVVVTGPGGVSNGFDQGGWAQPYAETISTYYEPNPATAPAFIAIPHIDQPNVPGTGFFTFFRGSQGGSYDANFTKVNAPYAAPEPVTITYRGIINKFNLPATVLRNSNNAGDPTNGYNLVGNPYPSAIDWNLMDRSAGVQDVVVIVKQGGGQASYINGVGNNGGSSIIQPGQGFLVVTNTDLATISFKEECKSINYPSRLLSLPGQEVISSTNEISYTPTPNKSRKNYQLLRLNLHDGKATDETTIVFQKDGSLTVGYEDVIYMFGSTVTLSSMSSDGRYLAINGVPELNQVQEIKLNINSTHSGAFKLRFTDLPQSSGYDIFLKDALFPGLVMNVKTNYIYDFAIDKGNLQTYGNNRFILIFKKQAIEELRLIAFTAKKQNTDVELSWVSPISHDPIQFEPEHSSDGKSFLPLAVINGGSQNQGNQKYYFKDENAVPGLNYYRIKQIDSKQRISISEIKTVEYSFADLRINSIVVYPNPVIDELEIILSAQPGEPVELRIYDLNGRAIISSVFGIGAQLRYNVRSLEPAIYIIEVKAARSQKLIGRKKFVKSK